MEKIKEERKENSHLYCLQIFPFLRFTLSSASPEDCSQEHKVLILCEKRKGPCCLLFPKPSTLQLVSPGSCLPYPPTPLQPTVSKMPFKMLLAKALSPGDLPLGSLSRLLISFLCTVSVWIWFTICQHKSAWEEGTVRKLHLNLLHNPVFTSFFPLASLDQPRAMPGRWIWAQNRRSANKQHHKLPPHKIKSLPSICRCCSGHSIPGNIGHIGIIWFVLLHQSATITYLTLHLANPCTRTALLQSKSHCTDHSHHLKIILEVVIPLIITSLEKNQVSPCPSR